MSQWSNLQRKAKTVESKLQRNIDSYTLIIQKLNEEFSPQYDEEHGEHGSLLNNNNDTYSKNELLMKEIEVDLLDLLECINNMKDYNNSNTNSNSNLNGISSGSNSRMNDELIKRYNEIYFDFNNEYKSLSVSI